MTEIEKLDKIAINVKSHKLLKVLLSENPALEEFGNIVAWEKEDKVEPGKPNAAGWIITNQLVFTTAASRRGHTAKLRKVLNDVGVLPYYTFTVKG